MQKKPNDKDGSEDKMMSSAKLWKNICCVPYYPSKIVFENRISMSQIIVCLKKYAKDSRMGKSTTSS